MSAYLTVKDVAERFQTSNRTVERLIERGQLPAVRLGPRVLRVREQDLPEALPAVASKPRKPAALPKCGVYMLYREGELIYIGRSTELPRRITNHRRSGRVFDEVNAIPCDAKTADWLEAELVRVFSPPENIKRFDRRSRRVEGALEGLV